MDCNATAAKITVWSSPKWIVVSEHRTNISLILIEESENTSSSLSATSLLMVHDTERSGQHNVTELTRGQEVADPLFHLGQLDVVARADDATLVDATNELDNNLVASVVINDLKVSNVAVLLHHLEELDNDLRGGSDQNLPLAGGLGVTNRVQGVVQDTCSNHLLCTVVGNGRMTSHWWVHSRNIIIINRREYC